MTPYLLSGMAAAWSGTLIRNLLCLKREMEEAVDWEEREDPVVLNLRLEPDSLLSPGNCTGPRISACPCSALKQGQYVPVARSAGT